MTKINQLEELMRGISHDEIPCSFAVLQNISFDYLRGPNGEQTRLISLRTPNELKGILQDWFKSQFRSCEIKSGAFSPNILIRPSFPNIGLQTELEICAPLHPDRANVDIYTGILAKQRFRKPRSRHLWNLEPLQKATQRYFIPEGDIKERDSYPFQEETVEELKRSRLYKLAHKVDGTEEGHKGGNIYRIGYARSGTVTKYELMKYLETLSQIKRDHFDLTDPDLKGILESIREMEERTGLEVGIYKLDNTPYHKTLEHDDPRGGLSCYLTTACTQARSLPDNCDELQTLRGFRDGWLAHQPEGSALIREYYATAPQIVQAINRQSNSQDIWSGIYQEDITRAVQLVKQGKREEALAHYKNLTGRLRQTQLG